MERVILDSCSIQSNSNNIYFSSKIVMFYSCKNRCILHRHVFVMGAGLVGQQTPFHYNSRSNYVTRDLIWKGSFLTAASTNQATITLKHDFPLSGQNPLF